MDKLDLFKQFLKEQDVYKQYITNLLKKEPSFEQFVKEVPLIHYVEMAFIWLDTIQGAEFWININTVWKQYISDNKIGGINEYI